MLKRVYALHGFFGSPSDWNGFDPKQLGIDELIAIDLQTMRFEDPGGVLMGYSLGGRIALRLLIDRPTFWRSAVIISAHPGLIHPEAKIERLKKDAEWAEKIRSAPWEQLLSQWNSQPIFQGSQPLQRDESDYNREVLAKTLEKWSLGHQENLREQIRQLPLPILWIYGELDKIYAPLVQTLSFAHPRSATVQIKGSGHRVPWDAPLAFQTAVSEWLCALKD